jgi:hypothetical protein
VDLARAQHGGVDLVREHGRARAVDDLRDRLELGAGVHATRRVLRVAQDEQVAGAQDGGEGVEVVGVVPGVVRERHLHDLDVGPLLRLEEARVGRGRQHDAAADGQPADERVQDGEDVREQPDPRRVDLDAVLPGEEAGRRLLAGGDHLRGEVAEHLPIDDAVQRVQDDRRRADVGLGDERADRVRPARPRHPPVEAAQVRDVLGCVDALGKGGAETVGGGAHGDRCLIFARSRARGRGHARHCGPRGGGPRTQRAA